MPPVQRTRVPPPERLSRASPLPVPPSSSTGICCHLPARSTAARPAPAPCLSPLPSVPACVRSCPVPAPQDGCSPIPPRRVPAPGSGLIRTLFLALERCPWKGLGRAGVARPPCQDTHPIGTPITPGQPFHQGIFPTRASIPPGHPAGDKCSSQAEAPGKNVPWGGDCWGGDRYQRCPWPGNCFLHANIWK